MTIMVRLNFILVGLLILCAFGLIQSQHKARKLFHDLKVAEQSARQMDIERDQLEIEQSNLVSPGKVNKVALRDLKMQKITPPQTMYVDANDKTVAATDTASTKPAGPR
jgi:cell division protein FtsL